LAALACALGAEPPSVAQFGGAWRHSSGRGITAVTVADGDGAPTIKVWGECQPIDCQWPATRLQSDAHGGATADWHDAIADRHARLRLDNGTLTIEVDTAWRDPMRRDVHVEATLTRDDMTDPFDDRELPPFDRAIKAAFRREFGEIIPRPAVFNDPAANDCGGNGHGMATAYLPTSDGRGDLLMLYTSRDGATVMRAARKSNVRLPAGHVRVATFVARYPATTGDRLTGWEAAQAQINADHVEFAAKRGFAAPIVVFDNVNVSVDPSETGNRSPDAVRALAERYGVGVHDVDAIAIIDINPSSGGGGSVIGGAIVVNNFSYWKSPLDDRAWQAIARTTYHQLMLHHWGWQADWAPTCGGAHPWAEPFRAPPTLFGWEDVDGDGVPEILDTTPYGRSPR